MTLEELQTGQVLLVDKPLDWTSFQAVNKIKYQIKRQFKIKKMKIGHAGTLDPKATGLLIVCTGKFTKTIPSIQDAPKEYDVELKLGVQTESYDSEKPEIFSTSISHLTEEQIKDSILSFQGEIKQTPPIFSAVKIDGKRAYDRARAGEDVKMKTRIITIFSISNIEFDLPFVRFTVACSKGTYIRSLAHDIGQKLEVGAYLTNLRRTKIGDYHIKNATNAYLDKEFKF